MVCRDDDRRTRRSAAPVPGASRRFASVLAMFAMLISLAGCESGDPTAPADSTIRVSASPQTVIVDPNGPPGASRITATLRSKNGTRLPDQEIVFETTAGNLFEVVNGTLVPLLSRPLETDDDGIAECILTTRQSATVTALSGSIMGTTQIQTASGEISSITLTVSATEIFDCGEDIELTATVRTSTGDPVSGVSVRFFSSDPPATHLGGFFPTSVVSDALGMATTTWRPGSTCVDDCSESNGMGPCTIAFQAEDLTGSIQSFVEQVDDQIP